MAQPGSLPPGSTCPALAAIRDEGGLPLADGSRLMPDVVLVARNAEKLAAAAAASGFTRTTTALEEALASPEETIFFDAAPSGLRVDLVRKAIAAGKHIYMREADRRCGLAEALMPAPPGARRPG